MALDLEEITRVCNEHEAEFAGNGDQISLSQEDELILDEVWREIAEKHYIERVAKGIFVIPDQFGV